MEGLQCLKYLLSGSLQKSFASPSCKMSYRISAPWNTHKDNRLDNRLDDYSSSFPLYHFIHAVSEHFTEHSFVLGAVLGPGT